MEIPAIERRRAGLDADRRCGSSRRQSFYLEPEPPVGRFSKAFFLPLLREFIVRRKAFIEVVRFR